MKRSPYRAALEVPVALLNVSAPLGYTVLSERLVRRRAGELYIEVRRPGKAPRVFLFDPKYKLDSQELGTGAADGRPVKMDIDKMHAYRDAIRTEDGRLVVEYAAILYPGPTVFFDEPGLTALRADPSAPEVLRRHLATPLLNALHGGVPPSRVVLPSP